MITYTLCLHLISDTTFGRGDGIAGSLDREVEHDKHGLPYLRGRTLKGLLAEEVDNTVFSLYQISQNSKQQFDYSAVRAARHALFGRPGSGLTNSGALHISNAQLPENIRSVVAQSNLNREQVLRSLTRVRRQTAIDRSGIANSGSLRSMRVINRETPMEATVSIPTELSDWQFALLAAGVLALRRGGTGRNRGRGKLRADLLDTNGKSVIATGYARLGKLVEEQS